MGEIKNVRADIYGLSKEITDGIQNNSMGITSLDAKMGNLSNPSLLINGNFFINQRNVSATSTVGYTVDRWKLTSGTFTKRTIGCKLSSGGVLSQGIENFVYNGYVFTASLRINDKTYFGTKTISFSSGTSSSQTMFENDKVIVLLKYDGTNMWFQITAIQEVNIDYAKLEFGEIASPYFFKTYESELMDCQRYYKVIETIWGRIIRYSSARLAIVIPCKKMRATPTIKCSDPHFQSYTTNAHTTTQVTGFTYEINGMWTDCIRILAVKNNHGIYEGHFYFSKLVLDAEM